MRVNGQIVREPGTRVEPERDRIEVAGRAIPPPAPRRYYALNKPVGVITTLEDPEGRRTVREFLPPGSRLFPVGRLDADTSGLLLVTNDGELAHRLMHPRYGVEKVYRAWLQHPPSEDQIARLRGGVEFEPGFVSEPARVRLLKGDGKRGLIEIAIHEGRYRQVRRMCEAVGLGVVGLHRAAYGPVSLGPLARGMWRELSSEEVARLRAVSARPRPRTGRGRPGEFCRARRGRVRTARPRRGAGPRPGRSDRPAAAAGTTGPRPFERHPRSARPAEEARPSPRRAFERRPRSAREPEEARRTRRRPFERGPRPALATEEARRTRRRPFERGARPALATEETSRSRRRPFERGPRPAPATEEARRTRRRPFERGSRPAREPDEVRPRPWRAGQRRARTAREREAGRPRGGRSPGPPARQRPAAVGRRGAARQPGFIGSGPRRGVGGGGPASGQRPGASARSGRRPGGSESLPARTSRGKPPRAAPSRSSAGRGRRPPRDRRG